MKESVYQVPAWIAQLLIGGLFAQLIAAIGWGIRVQMQLNKLTTWKEERNAPIQEYYREREEMAALKAQHTMILSTLTRLEQKVDEIANQVAKHEGRNGR